ncbi:MAG TPA: SpoIID/LytB domain-containing protein [Candidatus Hydrogenedentes bacterium]|nr:SpoIID/LytB domain-containing protein [Candidatus Hydrogenedentota bacterium]HPC16631.1 SpoIID/LytB domain-containing protein [Candidatus Hydrogenedentota bacterium]HRT20959.1 SpoIID/LytB domain-containing protein [Candidatus Hydrogenedentota bacterium]HRT63482.1 SpoIID/LytB domain-containing protein [Candidatus Hydrogenedentota bacterium]
MKILFPNPSPICVALVLFTLTTAFGVKGEETSESNTLTIQLAAARKELIVHADQPLVIEGNRKPLPPGAYTVQASGAHRAVQRFRLFAKTFPPGQLSEARQYAAQWKSQGYATDILPFGRVWKLESGQSADNRNWWVSIGCQPTLDKAKALKAALEKQSVWAWILPETIVQGRGKIHFRDSRGREICMTDAPARFHSNAPVRVAGIDVGFWKNQQKDRTYRGSLEIRIGPDAQLELYEHIALESYLAGVLPAEMPAGWPAEALKAQAVAARSEVVAALGGKHALEGFDFCGNEHCRAYGGDNGRQKTTDDAVAATRGMVLVAEDRVVPAVFSANCGGWTEHNDTVWSGPPNNALRGVPDFPPKANPAPNGPESHGWAKWLKSTPAAYCAGNRESFRWTKRMTAKELTDIVNKRYPVGPVRAIETGDRGVSGRLKWVKIIGTKKSEIVRKDLDIRLAFGGLNSAMFMVEAQGRPGSPDAFVFTGGGRGHGVGLCQDGARGMASAGATYSGILKHYFAMAALARLH